MKTKNKKRINAQITIFVIIAIVIVVLIGIILIVFNKNNLNSNYENDESYLYVKSCLMQTSENTLKYIGDSGGYFSIPDLSTDYGNPYYFYNNQNIMPSKGTVENETSNLINFRGQLCGFIDNPQYKVLNTGNLSTKTTISDDKVNFDVNFPITVEKAGRRISYKNFNFEIPARVGILYKAAQEYMQGQVENPEGICISCINDVANKYNVKFVTYNYDNDTIIFQILDDKTKMNNQSYYVYSFATKYDFDKSINYTGVGIE